MQSTASENHHHHLHRVFPPSFRPPEMNRSSHTILAAPLQDALLNGIHHHQNELANALTSIEDFIVVSTRAAVGCFFVSLYIWMRKRLMAKLLARKHVKMLSRFLMVIMHSAKCRNDVCRVIECAQTKKLLEHLKNGECTDNNECRHWRCISARNLIEHHYHCTSRRCQLCTPLRKIVAECARAF